MGLGDILGSLSPFYGAISGKGLGGAARNLSPLYLLLNGLFGHGGSSSAPPQAAPGADQGTPGAAPPQQQMGMGSPLGMGGLLQMFMR